MVACNQRYYNNVMEIGVDKFTRAYCSKNRYRMMSTQIVESMNSILLDLRKRPIAALTEQIRDMMENWFHNRRSITNSLRSDLTLASDNHIHKGVKPSYKCIIRSISYHRSDWLREAYRGEINPVSTCSELGRTRSSLKSTSSSLEGAFSARKIKKVMVPFMCREG
ncbi:hypothetical protein QYF36_001975 [Acer negundo]|nr:hypothetical protein QYF36_001975 [Acer negundo]